MTESGTFAARLQAFVYYTLALFYGALFIFQMVLRWIKNPSNRFWKTKKREIPPAVLNSPEFGDHAYMYIKNVKLHYVEKGDRSKPLMLLVHGFPEFWYSWRHQLKEFSDNYWFMYDQE